MKYADEEEMIVSAARMKMMLNAHKGNIESCPVEKIIELAKSELDELHKAWASGDWDQTIIEAGDCFNFLLAAVRKAKIEYRDRK